MTVRELIKLLRLYPLDTEVRMYSDEEGNRINGIFEVARAALVSGVRCVVLIPVEKED